MARLRGVWLRFDEILLGHRDHGIPDIPAAESKQRQPDDRLDDETTQMTLLPTDFFRRIGRSALRACQSRCIDLMFTSAAGDERHFKILIQMAGGL